MHLQPVISIQNVNKAYAGNAVLKDITLEVSAGEVIGYIGPNGAGKSTTIKILIGMIPDFEGEVRVLGYDIRKEALEVKRRIGYVPENAALYESLTPSEYLRFVGLLHKMDEDQIRRKTSELLHLLGLEGKEHHRMNSFSKGMKQKVLLISGLIHNPDIIFLDEPLSGLDANAVIMVKEIMARLAASGKTIFYSSHIMDVVEKISGRIVVLNQGRMIANGSFAEINANKSASLEQLFTELTGDRQHVSLAENFVNILGNRQ